MSVKLSERKRYLRDHNICYRCCNSDTQYAYNACTFSVKCTDSGSERHPAAKHYFQQDGISSTRDHDSERQIPIVNQLRTT